MLKLRKGGRADEKTETETRFYRRRNGRVHAKPQPRSPRQTKRRKGGEWGSLRVAPVGRNPKRQQNPKLPPRGPPAPKNGKKGSKNQPVPRPQGNRGDRHQNRRPTHQSRRAVSLHKRTRGGKTCSTQSPSQRQGPTAQRKKAERNTWDSEGTKNSEHNDAERQFQKDVPEASKKKKTLSQPTKRGKKGTNLPRVPVHVPMGARRKRDHNIPSAPGGIPPG